MGAPHERLGEGAPARRKASASALACGGAKGLIAHLKGIGAVVPSEGRKPLSPRDLRRMMAAFEAQGGDDGYQVLFGRVTRSLNPRP